MVEVDVRMTRDRRLVLLHDETIDRTTDKTGCLRQLTLEQVREADTGSQEPIPTLEEALQTAGGAFGMILELKEEGIGPETTAVVRGSGFQGAVVYASFLWDELVRVRAADRAAVVMPLMGKRLPPDPIREAVTLTSSHVGFSYRTLTPNLVKACQEAGLIVCAYTVNDSIAIRHVRGLQVDGIISDFPDRI